MIIFSGGSSSFGVFIWKPPKTEPPSGFYDQFVQVKTKEFVEFKHRKNVMKISQTRSLMRCDISIFFGLIIIETSGGLAGRPDTTVICVFPVSVRSLFPQDSSSKTLASCPLFLFPEEFGEHPLLLYNFPVKLFECRGLR